MGLGYPVLIQVARAKRPLVRPVSISGRRRDTRKADRIAEGNRMFEQEAKFQHQVRSPATRTDIINA